jgi:hypothetical protein
MSSSRFSATRLDPSQAAELWSRSDEARAFTRPENLECLVAEVEWWGVERSGEVVAAWPLVRAVSGGPIAPPPFCYFVGPMLATSLRASAKYHRYWAAYTAIMSAFVDALTAEYSSFQFSLPPGFSDIRDLEWWNADHPGEPGFRIRPRYTAEIELTRFPDDAALRQNFVRSRRIVVERWSAARPDVVDDVPTERLLELHDEALERSGGMIDDARHTALTRLITLVRSGAGSIIGVIPQGADTVEAAIVVLDGPNESNGVFYAASDAWRDSGLTVWTVWLGLVRARSIGKRIFDFNGANSPRRASDKHQYGAQARLYFDGSFG